MSLGGFESLVEVSVELPGGASYAVLVGHGARHRLNEVLPTDSRRVAVVTQDGFDWEVDPGREWHRFVIDKGESAKSMATVEGLCRDFARFGLTRADAVVGLGGGMVTDVAGFAASIYHRGTAVAHVPTTLLGQVDAAIGGKCGVNLPEGKNLVGTFWQPVAVLCDTEILETLPGREWASGRGEMAKYAFLGVRDLERLPIEEQVAACVAHKAAVVGADEKDRGARALLNYGHTMAHAIEGASYAQGIDIRHGEAVAIGLVFAARLARRLGRIDDAAVERHTVVVGSLGLPQALPIGISDSVLLDLVGRDKKAVDGLTFILDGPGGPEVVNGIERQTVLEVLADFPRAVFRG